MKAKLYANYFVLSAGKQTVYSVRTPIREESGLHEEVWVEIPDEMKPYETNEEDVVVTLNGTQYLLSQVLTSVGDEPAIRVPSPYPWPQNIRLKAVEK